METLNNHEPFQRLNPLNDFLFFKVMGEKGDEPQLIGFLNAVLGRSGKVVRMALDNFIITDYNSNVWEKAWKQRW